MISIIRNFVKIILSVTALALSAATANARPSASINADETDSVNRAIAVVMANSLNSVINNLATHGVPIDRVLLGNYIAQALNGTDLGFDPSTGNQYVEHIIRRGSQFTVQSQVEFMDSIASDTSVIKTPSGLLFKVIIEGEGVMPTLSDQVHVKYVARFSDGTVFDDTEGEIISFDVANEVPGFIEGLTLMKPGGTYRIVIPANLAYGEEGIPGIIPGNAALDFTITLDSVNPAPSED